MTNLNSNKLSHDIYSRRTKSGDLITLDFNPKGQLHGVPYWKVFKNGKLQGRIAPFGFGKCERIKQPLYINNTLVNECK